MHLRLYDAHYSLSHVIQTSTTFFSLCQTNYDILNGFAVNDDRLMNSDLTQVCTFIHPDY